MDLTAQLDLGDLRLRTLFQDDVPLLFEATRHEPCGARGQQVPTRWTMPRGRSSSGIPPEGSRSPTACWGPSGWSRPWG